MRINNQQGFLNCLKNIFVIIFSDVDIWRASEVDI